MTTLWGYADSRKTERWTGSEVSREAAIAEGRKLYPGQDFWICSGTKCEPARFMPDADWIVEDASNRAAEEVGEVAEDWPPSAPKEAMAELDAFLEAWAEKHMPCEFWLADGEAELIELPRTPTSMMTAEEITYARAADELEVDADGFGRVRTAWLDSWRARLRTSTARGTE